MKQKTGAEVARAIRIEREKAAVLDEIGALMTHSREWGADTLSQIADVFYRRRLADVDDKGCFRYPAEMIEESLPKGGASG